MFFKIDIDYSVYNSSGLPSSCEKWNLVAPKLIQHIQTETKNEIAKHLIKDFQSGTLTENQRNVLIVVGLHGTLYTRKQVQASAKNWKITLPESFTFMILHCKTENSLDIEIEKRRKLVMDNKATFQPMIAVFGDSLSSVIDKFCIVFDDIKYFSSDFIISLATLLKIYELFGLAFPGPSTNVFHYLQHLLLSSSTKFMDSKVHNLIKFISSES